MKLFLVLDKNQIDQKHSKGELLSRQKSTGNARSLVWNQFHEVIDKNTGLVVTNFVKCTICNQYYQYNGSTTSTLRRHKCHKSKQQRIDTFFPGTTGNRKLSSSDKAIVLDAATKFVVKDLRPLQAVEGEGMVDLIITMVQMGAKNPWLTNEDIRDTGSQNNT